MNGSVGHIDPFWLYSCSTLSYPCQAINRVIDVGFSTSKLTCDRIGQSQAITVGIVGLPQNNYWEIGGSGIVDAGAAILVVVAVGETTVEVSDRAQVAHCVIAVVDLLGGVEPGFIGQLKTFISYINRCQTLHSPTVASSPLQSKRSLLSKRWMNTPREDLDSPWKDILRIYFPQAMQFFFPNTAVLIDWDRPYEFLDKELLQVTREAELGRRYADQLVKVWLLEGEQVWLLLHVEVQSQWESGFAQRVFVYNFRIFDLYQQVPVSLAILCDERLSWRPQNFEVNYPDTRLNFEFGIVKLLDWRDRVAELETSDNPFAIVVLAHLKVIETKRNVEQRKAWKFRLTRMLYERGYERQQVLDLYRFIDWAMILPKAVELEFWQELQAFEEERKVTYVTNAERIGFERGIQEGEQRGRQVGIQEGLQEGRQEGEMILILRQIARRFGTIPPATETQIRSLPLSELENLGEALFDFSEISDMEDWLRSHS
jgi:Domain of unknown function (DUF4351)